jgi:hypothetical protein
MNASLAAACRCTQLSACAPVQERNFLQERSRTQQWGCVQESSYAIVVRRMLAPSVHLVLQAAGCGVDNLTHLLLVGPA